MTEAADRTTFGDGAVVSLCDVKRHPNKDVVDHQHPMDFQEHPHRIQVHGRQPRNGHQDLDPDQNRKLLNHVVKC